VSRLRKRKVRGDREMHPRSPHLQTNDLADERFGTEELPEQNEVHYSEGKEKWRENLPSPVPSKLFLGGRGKGIPQSI